jgi:hypothetical protein
MTQATVRDGHTIYQLTAGTAYRIARATAKHIDVMNDCVQDPVFWAAFHGTDERRWISFAARVQNDYGIGPYAIFASVMGHKVPELLEAQNGSVVRYRAQNLFEDSIDADYTVGEWRTL